MSRVVLAKGEQGDFLRRVRIALGGWDRLAQISGVRSRTIRDWARERWRMSFEAHSVRGKPYRSLGLSFTSHSLPLLRSVHRILCGIGLPAKCDGRRHVSIYKRAGIKRYLEVVGTKNPKHLQRFAE